MPGLNTFASFLGMYSTVYHVILFVSLQNYISKRITSDFQDFYLVESESAVPK